MKAVLFAFALSSLALVGCSGTKSEDHDQAAGTHTHADGSAHTDHAKTDSTKQEEFTVASDSAAAKPHDHPHKEGSDHKH